MKPRMKAKIIVAMTLLGLLGFSGTATADDSGFYLYGAAGTSIAKMDQGAIDSGYANTNGIASVSSSVSDGPSAYLLQFGYQFNTKSAMEIGYGGFGDLKYTLNAPTLVHESEKLKVFDVVYAATLPLSNGFALTSRAGLADVQSSGNGAIRDFGGHAIRITGGLGVKYNFNENFSVRADWNIYNAPPAAKIDGSAAEMFTLGVGYKF
ncbi:MAG TPA: outer membrane beta-barrel protein [Burkholderiaceae bacterium]|jgi:hypothetical protein|nr:outer membrane beta-barrel protein [Burkholderiaceae bacterium]